MKTLFLVVIAAAVWFVAARTYWQKSGFSLSSVFPDNSQSQAMPAPTPGDPVNTPDPRVSTMQRFGLGGGSGPIPTPTPTASQQIGRDMGLNGTSLDQRPQRAH